MLAPRAAGAYRLTSACPDLELLYIDQCTYTCPERSRFDPPFSRLRSLAIAVIHPSSSNLLSIVLALPLPQLRHLFLSAFITPASTLQETAGTATRRLGPNLETFALTDVEAGTLATLDWWTSMTSLRTLVISEESSNSSTPFALVPSGVRHLRLPLIHRTDHSSLSSDLPYYVAFVKGCLSPDTIGQLHTLSLTSLHLFYSDEDLCDEDRREKVRGEEANIEELCARHQVELRWGEADGVSTFPVYWEKIVSGGAEPSRSR